MLARTGTVLISRPIIESAPGRSTGRPDTAVPKTTSRCPVSAAEHLRPGRLQHGVHRGALRPGPAR